MELGLGSAQVGAAGSQTSWPEVDLTPTRDAQVEIIDGPVPEAVKILVDRLLAEKVI